MPTESPKKEPEGTFDVILPHGRTEDGEGTCVLRARPGRLEAGEVRPLKEGKPLAQGGEVVSLSPRTDSPHLYDVDVKYELPKRAAVAVPGGPPQIATRAYRESWERTFGPVRRELAN